MMQISTCSVNGIIFVFKKDEIVDGSFPFEGVRNVFVLQFHYSSDGQFIDVADDECLPFPCLYKDLPVCVSYMHKIYDFLYIVRRNLTNMMCRNSGKRGGGRGGGGGKLGTE